MEEQAAAKWEGEVSGEVKGRKPREVWPLLADFSNLHKWFPMDTCHHVEGVPGQPGEIRYCASTDTKSSLTPTIKWAKERLILIDPTELVLSYEIIDNNIGFTTYVATAKLLPVDDAPGCKIVLSFVCDPIQGWPLEAFVQHMGDCVQHMAEKMGDFLQKSG